MRIRRMVGAVLVAGLGVMALPAAGLAASVTATGTITGTTLSASTSATPTFSANLDTGDQTPTYTIPLTTQDTRGSGAGWNETITSTQFTTGAPNNYTLSTGASNITGVTSVNGTGTDTAPTNAITYPLAVPAAPSAPAAVKFFNAAANTGLGKFTVTPTVGVYVPQNSMTGTYTSTVTVALVSGP